MARGMMRHGAYTHSWQRGCAVLLLLVATAAVAAGQETDTAVTSADSQAAADAACADLSAVHIPDPAGRRDVYYVCCDSKALERPCLLLTAPGLKQSTDGEALYNPITGRCELMSQERSDLLFSRTADMAAAAGATSPGASQRAAKTSEAAAVCSTDNQLRAAAAASTTRAGNDSSEAVASYELPPSASQYAVGPQYANHNSTERQMALVEQAAREAALPPSVIDVQPHSTGIARAVSLIPGRAPTATAPVRPKRGASRGKAAAGGSSGAGRLRQAPGEAAPAATVGQFRLINNPNLDRSSTGIVAIHTTLIPGTSDVLLWSRLHPDGDPAYEPGIAPEGREVPFVGVRYSTATGVYTPVEMPGGAPFCSGHSILADGRIVAMGGDAGLSGQTNGLLDIRTYSPAAAVADRWQLEEAKLESGQWYPTQLVLPDQRVLALGGLYQDGGAGNPLLSVWDANTGTYSFQRDIPAAVIWQGRNVYPGFYLLPYSDTPGRYYMYTFSCNYGEVVSFDGTNTMTTLKPLPQWPNPDYCGQVSAQGTSRLLMLKPSDGYAPEVAMFGGLSTSPAYSCDIPASAKAYRIKLGQDAVLGGTGEGAGGAAAALAWEEEDMPEPRGLTDAVMLPDGRIVLLNGAKAGSASTTKSDPAYNAILYDPEAPAGERFTTWAASTIIRYYHSVALLLPDASILVAGSEDPTTCTGPNEKRTYQHQAEKFLPPYAFEPLLSQRPVIRNAGVTRNVVMGANYEFVYTGDVTGASLVAPESVTHQLDMQGRVIQLVVGTQRTRRDGTKAITVTMPPGDAWGGLVAPPGPYMLFLLNGQLPSRTAQWVRLRAP